MNLFLILLVYLAFFHTNHLLLNGIITSHTLAFLKFSRLFYDIRLNLFNATNVNWKQFCSNYRRLDSIPSRNAFDLVHFDVRRPSRPLLVHGFFYYLLLIDDYFHVSGVYLLKNHTKVLARVHQFLQEIYRHYYVTPKVLQIDNALDFV